MPVYQYTAVDKQGKQIKGSLEADNQKQLRAKLREKNLISLTVAEIVQDKNQKNYNGSKQSSKVNQAEIVLFTRQLATLLNSGMPVVEALTAVAEQTERPKVKNMVLAIRARVMEGHTLAAGLMDFPQAFSQMYCATVRAGEESGHLDQLLENLADYTENQQVLSQKIKSAAIYPALMIVVSIAIVAFLLSYVVPQLVTLFDDSEQSLPMLTTVVISVSDCIREYGLYVLAGVLVGFILFKMTLAREDIKEKYHAVLLKCPIIGKTIQTISTARYARTFSILLTAGLPALEAMVGATNVLTNIPIKKSLSAARIKVKEGNSINSALKQTKIFPPMSSHLIASGEASGQLNVMLTKAADTQDREIQLFINSVVSLFEPVLTLVMGALILIIVLAVLLPIFSLSQVIG